MTYRRILIKNFLIVLPLKGILWGSFSGMLLYFYLTILNLSTHKEAMVAWIGITVIGAVLGIGFGVKMFWEGCRLEKKTQTENDQKRGKSV